ncbi:MAG: ankyrin repeat domain-containing protein [Polyangiales bacterium]
MATKAQKLVPTLIRAIQARDLAAARAALDAGADPNGVGGFNVTPLGAATTTYRDTAARDALTALLLERGADPNARGPYAFDGRPIFYAAHSGYDAVVRMLLDRGGFPRDASGAPARGDDGSTLLALGCRSGMRWLVDRAFEEGCRADEVDRHGSTALHYAAMKPASPDLAGKDTASLIHLLIDRGALLEHQRPNDWGTALHWAVAQGDPPAVRALVARGADLEARSDRTARTPLLQGAQWGKAETVRAALELGADRRAVDASGMTALHVAARHTAHPSLAPSGVVELLLDAGLDAGSATPRA